MKAGCWMLHFNCSVSICICMYLWDVLVLELDSHHDHNKGAEPRTLYWSEEQSRRLYILDILHSKQPTLWLHYLCTEVLTVHGNELRLFGVKAFPLILLLMLCIWHSSSRYNFFMSLAMTGFGPSIETEHQASRHRAQSIKAEHRASGTRLTTAEHRTHYLQVLSGFGYISITLCWLGYLRFLDLRFLMKREHRLYYHWADYKIEKKPSYLYPTWSNFSCHLRLHPYFLTCYIY